MKRSFLAALALALIATAGVPVSPASAEKPSPDQLLYKQQKDSGLLDLDVPDGKKKAKFDPHAHHHHTPESGTARAAGVTAMGVAVAGPLAPSVGGQWSYLDAAPINGIHAITGGNGKKLIAAGSANQSGNFDAESFTSYVEDKNGRREVITPKDVFCSGHVLSSDGRWAFVIGGTEQYGPFRGAKIAWAFDFVTDKYVRMTDPLVGRWYPSVIRLWNGKILALGGLDETGKNTTIHELYDPATKKWSKISGTRSLALYPQASLIFGGEIFNNGGGSGGSPVGPGIWDIANNSYKPVPGLPAAKQRGGSTSCYFGDIKNWQHVLIGGKGSGIATNSVAVVDLDASANPAFKAGPSLPTPLVYANCVNLPDGTLLVIGGGKTNQIADANRKTLALTKLAGPWVERNPMPAGEHREYHSTACLEQDGSVTSQTSNPSGDDAWSTSVLRYEPNYLHRGTRPVLTSAPTTLNYGKTYPFSVKLTDGATLKTVSLTSLCSSTHAADVNQRHVNLAIKNGNSFYVNNWKSAIPPGAYHLWAYDSKGRLSVARPVTVK